MIRKRKKVKALPLRQIYGILIGAGILLYFLIPSDEELFLRLLQDQKTDRAREIFARLPDETRTAHPSYRELLDLQSLRKDTIAESKDGLLSHDAAEELLRRTSKACRDSGQYDIFGQELGRTLARMRDSSQTAQWFAQLTQELPRVGLLQFKKTVAERSEILANPAPKALFLRAKLTDDGTTLDEVQELVAKWRASNMPAEALHDIERFMETKPPPFSDAEVDLIVMQIRLLRELNRNSDAFDLLRLHEKYLRPKLGDNGTFSLLTLTGRAAGREKDLIPDYEKFIQKHPANHRNLRILANLYIQTQHYPEAIATYRKLLEYKPEDTETTHKLAQLYEWNGSPDEAFTLYHKLALQGRHDALERMKALNPGLYRDEELIDALPIFLPKSGTSSDLLLLADLLVGQGRYEEAEKLYLRHLRSETQDLSIYLKLGALQNDQDKWEAATATLEKALSINSSDPQILKSLADLYFIQGREQKGFAILTHLAQKSADPNLLEEYVNTAESMGRQQAVVGGLELLIEHSQSLSPDIYLRLAYQYSLLGNKEKNLLTLRRGAEKFPNHVPIALEYVTRLSERKRYTEAIAFLETGSDRLEKSDPLQRLYLELLITTKQNAKAFTYLRSLFEREPGKKKLFAATAGYLYETLNNFPEAEHYYRLLYQTNPGSMENIENLLRILNRQRKKEELEHLVSLFNLKTDPQQIRLAAQVYSELEKHRQAREMLLRYIDLTPKPESSVWRLLGDTLLSMGDRKGAKRAYRRALAETFKEFQWQS